MRNTQYGIRNTEYGIQTDMAKLVSALWAQVRTLADRRELDLDLRLLGKPSDVSEEAREILSRTVGSVIQSAQDAQELHHFALELSYQADTVNVRIEHDGTIETATRAATEQDILAHYGDIGEMGGSLSLSSGRGFGLRLDLTLPFVPYAGGGMPGYIVERALDPPRARAIAPVAGASPIFYERLTPQEEVCLSLLAAGLSNKEIAVRMHLGVGTVKYHLAQIYQKLGVQGRGRGAAVARARELGIIFD